ncbi:hypothetical protein B0H19DRAFT_1269202 [Mycena capillaripes]|nr:hypothetical protein B0H19DRAFT_1269202 [Mycena capillaripes]
MASGAALVTGGHVCVIHDLPPPRACSATHVLLAIRHWPLPCFIARSRSCVMSPARTASYSLLSSIPRTTTDPCSPLFSASASDACFFSSTTPLRPCPSSSGHSTTSPLYCIPKEQRVIRPPVSLVCLRERGLAATVLRMPMPFSAIRRLLPPVVGVVRRLRSASPPPSQMFSAVYSRALKAALMTGPLAPGGLYTAQSLHAPVGFQVVDDTYLWVSIPVAYLAANSRSCQCAKTLYLRFWANIRKRRRDEHGGMKLHIAPRPVPSICRVDVYLRRGPTAPLTAHICRRDSLAHPSSRSARPRHSDDTLRSLSHSAPVAAILSAHVPLAISREFAADGCKFPLSFLSAPVSSSTLASAQSCSFAFSEEDICQGSSLRCLHRPQSAVSKTEHQVSRLESPSLSFPECSAICIAQNSLTVRVAIIATTNQRRPLSFESGSFPLLFSERVRDTTTFFASSSPSTSIASPLQGCLL